MILILAIRIKFINNVIEVEHPVQIVINIWSHRPQTCMASVLHMTGLIVHFKPIAYSNNKIIPGNSVYNLHSRNTNLNPLHKYGEFDERQFRLFVCQQFPLVERKLLSIVTDF